MDQPVYKRILLKLSGEALAPANREDGILDFPFIDKVAAVLKKCREAGVEIGVIVGAGNMDAYADRYNARAANRLLSEGKIVIFGCGMGVPYFSTDTAAVLRAAEIGADALLMAKNVDYLYTADPRKDPDAKPIHDITYTEILEKNLRAFDMTAVSFCNENGIEAYGFALADPENIYRVVMGQPVGTRMHT